jgi:hypothetical protein
LRILHSDFVDARVDGGVHGIHTLIQIRNTIGILRSNNAAGNDQRQPTSRDQQVILHRRHMEVDLSAVALTAGVRYAFNRWPSRLDKT